MYLQIQLMHLMEVWQFRAKYYGKDLTVLTKDVRLNDAWYKTVWVLYSSEFQPSWKFHLRNMSSLFLKEILIISDCTRYYHKHTAIIFSLFLLGV